MTAALFPYQDTGASWLAARPRGYLADEMGLGKTPQAVVGVVRAVDAESLTIICPAFLKANWQREIERWATRPFRHEVLSYEIAARDGMPEGDIFVFDEAHYLKNPAAKRTKAILGSKTLQAARLWPLSGTPAPNHPAELWPWLRKFGATTLKYGEFIEQFCTRRHTQWGLQVTGLRKAALPELQQLLKPWFLRRTRDTVGLPRARWGDISLASEVDSNDLNALLEHIVVDDWTDLPEDEALSRAMRLIGEAKAGPLAEVLGYEHQATGEKIVVFAWHKSVIDRLHAGLHKHGVVRVDGNTAPADRQALADKFQTDPSIGFFLGQHIAAGTGLTLTAACNLVLAELSWTPGHNAQAAYRVDRIGQTRPVLIRTATLAGTLDEAAVRVNTRKTKDILKMWSEPDGDY